MSEADYVEFWFIGGPWNNQLVALHKSFLSGRSFRLPIPDERPIALALGDQVTLADIEIKCVEYFRAYDLETGVPVFSCLPFQGRQGTHFGLTSVKRTST